MIFPPLATCDECDASQVKVSSQVCIVLRILLIQRRPLCSRDDLLSWQTRQKGSQKAVDYRVWYSRIVPRRVPSPKYPSTESMADWWDGRCDRVAADPGTLYGREGSGVAPVKQLRLRRTSTRGATDALKNGNRAGTVEESKRCKHLTS